MTAQANDPRSLLAPKPGWAEHLGPRRFRLVFSPDEVRIFAAYEARPEMGAYIRAVEAILKRVGGDADTVEVNLPVRGLYARGLIAEAE